MDCCSKYSGYTATNPMASRIGESVLSSGPPNRIAPNVTLIAGHRHQQALRYQEQQHRLAVANSSEGLYQQHHHSFDRYHPAVSYAGYNPPSYGTAGLGYGNLERRESAAYLNPHAHTQHPHHLYHPAHYDSTYNGRMIGGAGTPLPYHSYRGAYEHHREQGIPSSVLHYTARSGPLQYGHHMPNASPDSHQREYLSYYPYHHPFPSEQSYSHHNLHSMNGLQLSSPKTDGRSKVIPHITQTDLIEQQQQRQQQNSAVSPASSLTSVENNFIASPTTSGSTTSDSIVNGNSRCGSTPISSVTSIGAYNGQFSQKNCTSNARNEESNTLSKDVKDEQRSLPATPDIFDENKNNLKDHQFSPKPPCPKPLASPSESEKLLNGNVCASSRSMGYSNPMVNSPERCGTPYISTMRTQTSFQSPHRLQSTHKWSPNHCEQINTPSFSPKSFMPKPKKKTVYTPVSTSPPFVETKKKRVVECDLIPSKKSKKKSDDSNTDGIREEIRDIKPLPGFQQAFGSTEIGRFFETFLNIPSCPYDSVYSCESETDMSPQPWEIESSVEGSQFDVQISASLQSMYKTSLGDKNFFSGIRCNGY